MDENIFQSVICKGNISNGGFIIDTSPNPKPQSTLMIGDKYYKTIIPSDQHFNWFQKLMWKLCFGIKVEDYSGD